jgi:hypothetical protein
MISRTQSFTGPDWADEVLDIRRVKGHPQARGPRSI